MSSKTPEAVAVPAEASPISEAPTSPLVHYADVIVSALFGATAILLLVAYNFGGGLLYPFRVPPLNWSHFLSDYSDFTRHDGYILLWVLIALLFVCGALAYLGHNRTPAFTGLIIGGLLAVPSLAALALFRNGWGNCYDAFVAPNVGSHIIWEVISELFLLAALIFFILATQPSRAKHYQHDRILFLSTAIIYFLLNLILLQHASGQFGEECPSARGLPGQFLSNLLILGALTILVLTASPEAIAAEQTRHQQARAAKQAAQAALVPTTNGPTPIQVNGVTYAPATIQANGTTYVPITGTGTIGPRPTANNLGLTALILGGVSVVALVAGYLIRANATCTIDWNTFQQTCGAQGLTTALIWLSIIAGLVGIGLGIAGIVKCRHHEATNLATAIIGLCLSAIILIILIAALLFIGSLL